MLCGASTSLTAKPPNIEFWTSEHFEAYVRYLNKRPFAIYALSYLEKHLHRCEDARISGLVSQLYEQLTDSKNPASCIFGNWVPRNWCPEGAADERQNSGNAKEFRAVLLHTAIRKRYSRAAEILLIAGAEVEGLVNGKTPLIASAESGDYATARLLLGLGAFIGAKDDNKQTALHLAATNGHDAVAGLLIDRGADREAKDKEKQTALHLATANGHNSVVGLLIGRGADKEVKDILGW
jgi:ankyrin repeat protein